jgi:hypothetical protein
VDRAPETVALVGLGLSSGKVADLRQTAGFQYFVDNDNGLVSMMYGDDDEDWPALHTPQQFSPIAHNTDHLLCAFWTASFTARPPDIGSGWCTLIFQVSNRTIGCILRLYGYQPIFKKSKTNSATGIAMGALAVLPSNKCGADETFHDWSIPPYAYAATCVVPSVSPAFLWAFCGHSSSVSAGEIGRKSAENVQRNARETASTLTY